MERRSFLQILGVASLATLVGVKPEAIAGPAEPAMSIGSIKLSGGIVDFQLWRDVHKTIFSPIGDHEGALDYILGPPRFRLSMINVPESEQLKDRLLENEEVELDVVLDVPWPQRFHLKARLRHADVEWLSDGQAKWNFEGEALSEVQA